LWEWDVRRGEVFWSERQKAIFGVPADHAVAYESWHSALHPEDRDGVVAHVTNLLDPSSGGQLAVEHRIVRPDGVTRWILSRGRMLYEVIDGELRASRLLGTVLDITERKQAEEERLLLARELNHRVKNLFAVASGMVALTARTAATPKDMGIALRGRLDALARAHDLIQPVIGGTDPERSGTSIADLVHAVLAPYEAADRPGRLDVQGPAVLVGSNAATALTLVLHELATNAAKYGALCVPDGRLSMRWTQEESHVAVHWVESGGPVIESAPTAEGFGSLLARKSIAGQLGGTLAQEWDRDGLRVTIALPVERLAR
jgi:PAS domain S-box-containing protein